MNIPGVTFTKTSEELQLVETFDGYKFYIFHEPNKPGYFFKPFKGSSPTTAAHLTLRYKLHKRLNCHEY